MRRHLRPAIVVLASAAWLSACGGTGIELGGERAGGAYPAAADAVCAEVRRDFATAQAGSPADFADAAALTEELLDIAEAGEEALAAIEPPPADADAYERYLSARARAVDALEAGLAAARAEDASAYQAARDRLARGAGERAELARRAGLDGCAARDRGAGGGG